jgi:hypothetical protein
MRWIKSRSKFLNEAKLREVILPKQASKVKELWGEKFLDYEEVTPTDKIKQGKWKLSEEDKNKVLSAFFSTSSKIDISEIEKSFQSLPDKFVEVLNESLATISELDTKGSNSLERAKEILNEFNIKSPSIDEIVAIYQPVFRKLSNETIKSEMVQKDENGRPVLDENGKIIKVSKEVGQPIFERNLVNIKNFVGSYNLYFEEKVNPSIFDNRTIDSVINIASDDINGEYKTSFKIFNRDIYLNITHNPKDILNMSISKFYTSCQHLYTGGYNERVLGNVFDPNSIPAFLVFDTPIYSDNELISEQLPLSRMVIRNIEDFDNTQTNLFFDRAYPDRIREGEWGDVFLEIVEKYSGNKHSKYENYPKYIWTPDIESQSEIDPPYMDRLDIETGKLIGVNTKKLYLNNIKDWSKVKISPNAKIKELIIETPDLPSNFFNLKLDLDWIKFKLIDIKNLENFKSVSTKSIAFDKCKVDTSEIKKIFGNVNKLQLSSCDLTNLDLSGFDLDELQLIYTFDGKIEDVLKDSKFKKLVISGDVLNDKENKDYINNLKRKGIKIETVGLVL